MKKTAFLLAILLLLSGCKAQTPTYTPVEKDWPEKKAESEDHHAEPVIPWEELPLQAQYYEIAYNGVRYTSRTVPVDASLCTEELASLTAETRDYSTQNTYECKITLSKIQGISSDCAVAVQFEGTGDRFAYTNPYYRPETLGDLVKDLGLREHLAVGSGWYQSRVEFPEVPAGEVWKLFQKAEAENAYSGQMLLEWMSVEVSIPLLGVYEADLWVTEEGYLATNLLDTRKAFFNGPEAASEFVGYVTNCCPGYRIVYE